MPARPHSELLELLSTYDLGVQTLALALRDVVIDTLAPCNEIVYEVYIISIVYGITPRAKDAVCYIGVTKDHVNLGFYRGASLSNRHGLLEGEGKQMRHIKIRNMDDAMNPALREYIEEACEQCGHEVARPGSRTVATQIKRKNEEKRSLGAKKI
jgi:hypothetical protein